MHLQGEKENMLTFFLCVRERRTHREKVGLPHNVLHSHSRRDDPGGVLYEGTTYEFGGTHLSIEITCY